MPSHECATVNALSHSLKCNDSIHSTEPATTLVPQDPRGSAVIFVLVWMFLGSGGLQLSAQQAPQSSMRKGSVVELDQSASSDELSPPLTVTLQDAMQLARKANAQYLSAATDAKNAREDTAQARAALLPSLGYTQQYLNTQGNGGRIPTGRYITNDGVHVYRAVGVFHQEMPAGFFSFSPYHRATAAAALAQAKAEIAQRGLAVTVTKLYYELITAQHKYATAEQILDQAQRFLDITKKLESGGEIAHSDVVKANLQVDQQQLAFREAELAMNNAHLALAVLLFPNFNQHFTAVDDLDQAPVLPSFPELRAMAERENQDVRAAMAALRQSRADVAIARAAFFPTLSLDVDYGIEANAFALRSTVAADPQAGRLPNLGYFATATLNVPVWNWGATRSKLHQAENNRGQAQIELSQAQREVLGNLYAFYNEVTTVRSEAATLREAADLAAESLRLTTLRYRAGEATALEVLDAQNALAASRNGFSDGQGRYRVALATLQTLTGPF